MLSLWNASGCSLVRLRKLEIVRSFATLSGACVKEWIGKGDIDSALIAWNQLGSLQKEKTEDSVKQSLVALCVEHSHHFQYAAKARILQKQLYPEIPLSTVPSGDSNLANQFQAAANFRIMEEAQSNPALALKMLSENYAITPKLNHHAFQSSLVNLSPTQQNRLIRSRPISGIRGQRIKRLPFTPKIEGVLKKRKNGAVKQNETPRISDLTEYEAIGEMDKIQEEKEKNMARAASFKVEDDNSKGGKSNLISKKPFIFESIQQLIERKLIKLEILTNESIQQKEKANAKFVATKNELTIS